MAGSTTGVSKIDSNATGLRFTEEAAVCVLSDLPVWYELEPNSYSDFGGQVTTAARSPINAGRQRKKGTPVDLDASGGYQQDLTQENFQRLLRSFFFANYTEKTDTDSFTQEPIYNPDGTQATASTKITITAIDDGNDEYDAASGLDSFLVNHLVFARGFPVNANNGLKTVTSAAATALGVAEDLVADSPGAAARLTAVGYQFPAGDVTIATPPSSYPTLTSATITLTTLGLQPGEWVYLGGDGASFNFPNVANKGWARVRSVSATTITFDKTETNFVAEGTTTETVQMFFGRVLKNEANPANQVRRTYQFERTLGASDDTAPTNFQAEYLPGSLGNELTFNFETGSLLTGDLSFLATDSQFLDENDIAGGVNFPGAESDVVFDAIKSLSSNLNSVLSNVVEADAFNATSDVKRVKIAVMNDTTALSNPDPLFSFAQTFTVGINNGATPNKAIGVFGAFDISVGNFEVGGDITAYFNSVAASQAVRDSADVTFDIALVKQNSGAVIDLPLLTLGDGRPNVTADEPITLPLTNEAATGAKFGLDHTLLICFFDYLPNAADV